MKPWNIHVGVAVPHLSQPCLLLIPAADQTWTLPTFTLNMMYSHLHLLQQQIRAAWGAEMTVLRWLSADFNEETHEAHCVWLMDVHTADWTPPAGSQWFTLAELGTRSLHDEKQREPLERAFQALTLQPATPWYQQGWFREARAWMEQQLTAQGYPLTQPIEQFKQFSISSLLRAETAQGIFFFKVALDLPLFGHEPKLLATLGQLFPQHIPAPLVIDEARRWMMSADFGTTLREKMRANQAPSDALVRVVQAYARFQIATIPHTETLFANGCLDRRLDVLETQIDALLADEECCAEFSATELADWLATAPHLKTLCGRLAAFGLPATLVHGDFHNGNVALVDEKVLFFDWTDACIAHPFFDLPILLDNDLTPEEQIVLRDAYLQVWTDHAPLEQLVEIYRLADILANLHQAVSYQGIYRGVDLAQRHEWQWAVPYFARRIIAQLPTLI